MAQRTSELWKELWRTKNTRREYQFDVNGVIYGPDAEVSHSVDSGLFEEFGIGNAACSQLSVSLFADNIPRGATIKRYVRLANGNLVSEWLPAGVFFTNRRAEDNGYWTVEAFDAMRKADVPWEPDQSLRFPLPMDEAVKEFARIMEVEIDPRTSVSHSYAIDYPVTDPDNPDPANNNYSIRQELQWIAAAHGGNWIITAEGKLYLVPLGSEPEETNYLVTERGDAIVVGGVRLLV